MKDIKFWMKFGLLLFIMGCFVSYRNNSDIDQILSIILTVIGGSLFAVGHNWAKEDLEWKISKLDLTPNSILVVRPKIELTDAQLENMGDALRHYAEYNNINVVLFPTDVDLTVVEKTQ